MTGPSHTAAPAGHVTTSLSGCLVSILLVLATRPADMHSFSSQMQCSLGNLHPLELTVRPRQHFLQYCSHTKDIMLTTRKKWLACVQPTYPRFTTCLAQKTQYAVLLELHMQKREGADRSRPVPGVSSGSGPVHPCCCSLLVGLTLGLCLLFWPVVSCHRLLGLLLLLLLLLLWLRGSGKGSLRRGLAACLRRGRPFCPSTDWLLSL